MSPGRRLVRRRHSALPIRGQRAKQSAGHLPPMKGFRPMIKLYWSPRSRSISAIWLLEETGLPYERVLTDITTGAQKAPEYLAINPMGKVPGLKDGDAALGEAAAICAYIADRYPETKLAPAATDPLRARYLQWLFFSPSCIEPALIQLFTKLEVP